MNYNLLEHSTISVIMACIKIFQKIFHCTYPLLFYCFDNIPWTWQSVEGSVYLEIWFLIVCHCEEVVGTTDESCYIFNCQKEAEYSHFKRHEFWNSQRLPLWHISPSRPAQPLQTVQLNGDQVSKFQRVWGVFIIQITTFHTLHTYVSWPCYSEK